MKLKKKHIILIVIFIGLILLIPLFNIIYTKNYYEKTNPYFMDMEQVRLENSDSSKVVDIPVQIDIEGVSVTNFVYFYNINQLSFGMFYNPDIEFASKDVQITIYDLDGGKYNISTGGSENLLYKKIEKIFVNEFDINNVSKIVIDNAAK